MISCVRSLALCQIDTPSNWFVRILLKRFSFVRNFETTLQYLVHANLPIYYQGIPL